MCAQFFHQQVVSAKSSLDSMGALLLGYQTPESLRNEKT